MSSSKKRWVISLCLILLLSQVSAVDARITITLSAPGLQWDILPAATFTVDDWKNNPGLWSITIINTDGESYPYAYFHIELRSNRYGDIIKGNTDIFEVPPHSTVTKNNTDFSILFGEWSNPTFEDDAIDLGILPADTYEFIFQLWDGAGFEERANRFNTPKGEKLATESLSIEITNPAPPVLIAPFDEASTGPFPTFQWQMCHVRKQPVWGAAKLAVWTERSLIITYTLHLYKGFDSEGTEIPAETAVVQNPIWEKAVPNGNSALFSTGEASENLIPGRKYYWYVYAEDEVGYPVGSSDGKSEIWAFTVQFMPPRLTFPTGGEEVLTLPPTFSWNKAVAAGMRVYYELSMDTDPNYTGPYEPEPVSGTSHTYPSTGPPLPPAVLHYWKLQAVDAYNHPLGTERQETFITPPLELISPVNKKVSTLTPSLIWKAYWNVSSYEVRVRDQAGSDLWTKVAYTTQVKYDGPALSYNTPYKWSVRARDGEGRLFETRSAETTFTTPATSEVYVTLIYPVEVIVNDLFPTFTWEALTEATDYVITVQDNEGYQIHQETTPAIEYPYPSDATPLAYDAHYRWYVQARKEGVGFGNPSEIVTFYTPSASEQPLAMGTSQDTDISIGWGTIEDAVAYTMVISLNSDYSDTLWTHTTSQTAVFYPSAAPPLEPDKVYYWRIEGKDTEGNVVGVATGTIIPKGAPGEGTLTLGWDDLDQFFQAAFLDLFASGADLEGYHLTGATEDGAYINPERLRQLLDLAEYEIVPIGVK